MRKEWILFTALAVTACTQPATSTTQFASSTPVQEIPALRFHPENGVEKTLTMPTGEVIKYKAYEKIFYVTNIEDSTYQSLNIYVPEKAYNAGAGVPIFLRNYVGGYMASAANTPSATDATGRALKEGYVVCIPGARGSNSTVKNAAGETVYTGRAPSGLVDLKAAVRYLKYNDDLIPGDSRLIISDGTSAGGAMSSLLGATGNNPAYDSYLTAMGAAPATDDIFAAVCYCPIIDLDHADMAYEWFYGFLAKERGLTEEQKKVSEELASQYPDYINSLGLKMPDGTPITSNNYMDYVKSFLVASLQRAKDEGVELPDNLGVKFNEVQARGFGGMRRDNAQGGQGRNNNQQPPQGMQQPPQGMQQPPQGGQQPPQGMQQPPQGMQQPPQGGQQPPQGMQQPPQGMQQPPQGGNTNRQAPSFGPNGNVQMQQQRQGEFVIDLDMPTYLTYVANSQALKNPPAFDQKGVGGGKASPENNVFGDATGSSVNFTSYSLQKATNNSQMDTATAERVRIYNPMNFIGDGVSHTAPHWYIRHGGRDRDTSFSVPINLYTKLMNNGYDVDFALPYNRPHSGDYNLNDLFRWIEQKVAEANQMTSQETM